MSKPLHKVTKLGFGNEAIAGTENIDSNDEFFKFGARSVSSGNFLNKRIMATPLYAGGQYDAYDWAMGKTEVEESITIIPVNGIPLYWFLGKSTIAAGVHQIRSNDYGDNLPTWSTRWQSQFDNTTPNPSHYMYNTAIGCEMDSLSIDMNFSAPLTHVRFGMGVKALDVQASTVQTNLTPFYPYQEAQAPQSYTTTRPYIRDSNFEFTWDLGGSNTNYKTDIMSFSYNGTNNVSSEFKIDQSEAEWMMQGNRLHTWGLNLASGADLQIFTDFMAQTLDSTFDKTLRVKIYNSATDYIQLDLINSILLEAVVPDANVQAGTQATTQIRGLSLSLEADVKDGVDGGDFYGET